MQTSQKFIATLFAASKIGSPDRNGDSSISSDACQHDFAAIFPSGAVSLLSSTVLGRGRRPQSRQVEPQGHDDTFVRVQDFEFSVASDSPEFTLPHVGNSQVLVDFERKWGANVVFQSDPPSRRRKQLCVFDMDSTLIQQEVIDEIAKKLHVEAQVSAITHRAMNGELDFTASLRERVALLKGTPATVFDELKNSITLTNGARELVKALKTLGFKTAVLSGGFTPLTSWLASQLGLDYAFANHLAVSEDGKTLTGEVTGEIVDGAKKREHVQQIAAEENIPLKEVIAIGDGANDIPMMQIAGLGIAFNAKPKVQLQAPARINSDSLLDVLYLLGLNDEDIRKLL